MVSLLVLCVLSLCCLQLSAQATHSLTPALAESAFAHEYAETNIDHSNNTISGESLEVTFAGDALPHHAPAFVRREGLHPSIRIMNRRTTSMAAKFRCLVPKMDYYYDDGAEGIYQGTLAMGRESTTNTYEGHVFFFTEAGDKSKELARYTMNKDEVVYIVSNPKYAVPAALETLNQNEKQFMQEYYNKTGLHWRHFYGPNGPRAPPVLHMWPAKEVGDIHHITSRAGKWHCNGPAEDCQSSAPLHFEMEVISTHPKAFIIKEYFSDFEADSIIATAQSKLKASYVGNADDGGGRESDTRTSRNAWLPRGTTAITETLFRRTADLLNISDTLLQNNRNVEDMQVVSYDIGQRYDSHHDWGVSGYPESRYITVLLYLNDMPNEYAGGETSFPKGADGLGVKVLPKKRDAMVFYNLLEDGNGDDLSLHAAMPVHEGKKWLANFWVWDPRRRN